MQCPKCGEKKMWKDAPAGSGRMRWRCSSCKSRTTNPNQEPPEQVEFQKKLPKARKYIITAAQNATPVHKGFFQALQNFAKHVEAELIIIPLRYRNPTSRWTKENESHEWWKPELEPFMYAGRFNLNKNLTIVADIKITPTAVTPLTGLEGVTGDRSGIVGHTKIQLTTVPTPRNRMAKIMTTTGAVTVSNYSDTKAGKKGEFHHALGATMIELTSRGGFHMRQISACRDGSFIELNVSANAEIAEKAPRAKGLVMGDTHNDFTDPKVDKATFGAGGIVELLNPEKLVWHDVDDFYPGNHHHRGNPFIAVAKQRSGMDDVRGGMQRACDYVYNKTPRNCLSVLVASNHPEAQEKWLKDTDWRYDPVNAEFYLETALAIVRSAKMGKQGATYTDPFIYWARKMLKTMPHEPLLLDRGDSHLIENIEVGAHGDKGANGARGNIRTYAKIGSKSIIGHSHSPGISDGCYQVGTSTYLKLEYNQGLSGWLQAHCVIYANGKRSLIFIIDGKFRS